MSGTKAIFDSNAIILASKAIIDTEKLLLGSDSYYASIITFIEVYAYDFKETAEKEIVDEILGSIEIIELNQEIAEQAITYRKNKIKKIKLPDAVILATAKIIGADLITDNYRDFQNIDSSVNIRNLDQFNVQT